MSAMGRKPTVGFVFTMEASGYYVLSILAVRDAATASIKTLAPEATAGCRQLLHQVTKEGTFQPR